MDFAAWLESKGWVAADLTESQRLALQAAWRAEQKPAPVPTPEPPAPKPAAGFEAEMEAIERENARIAEIRRLTVEACKANTGDTPKIEQLRKMCEAAEADTKTDIRDFRLALLRFDRGSGPLVFAPSAPQVTAEVVEAAVLRAGGLKSESLEREYDDRTLSAADRRFKRGIGLQEMIGMAARQNGWRGDSVKRDLRSALRAAFRPGGSDSGLMATSHSTLSVSSILSNTANKFLRESFMFVEQEWRKLTAVRSVSDFKTITSYCLTGDNTYSEVAPGGKLEHGTLGDEEYTNRADTYGKILGIDRRDLINDDLGAFAAVNRRLGRGGALKINEVFWTEWMADASTFYTASRGNYDDGTDTAFSNDGLVAANVIWDAKTDPDGKPLGGDPRYLVVPPAHKIPAWRLMNSQSFDADSEEGDQNPWAGKYEVVVSKYLANSAFTGYSTVAWYLVMDPNDLPVIETCFLDGVEMPTIEEVELDGDQLGMAMRAYWDFGCNKQEYRAALKLKGEA